MKNRNELEAIVLGAGFLAKGGFKPVVAPLPDFSIEEFQKITVDLTNRGFLKPSEYRLPPSHDLIISDYPYEITDDGMDVLKQKMDACSFTFNFNIFARQIIQSKKFEASDRAIIVVEEDFKMGDTNTKLIWQRIDRQIDGGKGTPEEKEKVKHKFRELLQDSLFNTLLGAALGALLKT